MLKYIYLGNVSVTDERAHNLIATANYLLLPSLKTMVGNFMNEVIQLALCYHPKENMWYRLEDSPFDYPNNTPIQYKSKIYTGSTCNEGMSQVMEYYVPTANTWGAVQSTVEPNFTGYTVLKGDLYATCFSTQEGRIYRYDADTKH